MLVGIINYPRDRQSKVSTEVTPLFGQVVTIKMGRWQCCDKLKRPRWILNRQTNAFYVSDAWPRQKTKKSQVIFPGIPFVLQILLHQILSPNILHQILPHQLLSPSPTFVTPNIVTPIVPLPRQTQRNPS